MSDSDSDRKRRSPVDRIKHIHIEENGRVHQDEGANAQDEQGGRGDQRRHSLHGTSGTPKKSASQSPSKPQSKLDSAPVEEIVGGDVTVKMEPGQAPKLERSSKKKIPAKPAPLFHNEPDATADACKSFELIKDCVYANKYLGTTDHALECDCAEEWDPATAKNHACGEDSDCINRATKMECVSDCNCGSGCQNRRFQKRKYAKVAVFKTEKKGFGLRAETNLRPHEFIFEYIGEVIGEGAFRRRMTQYDEEGIKHFYFMSLNKGEFVDATRRGNLGRFCNHSCNPNCYVDKWVVGEKLRMGIFAERKILAGEELVFNYNVDRYGANPQPCYCGEPNCTGYIGGKTQTERATKLSALTIEALGIEDGDGWDLAVARRPRKKKTEEDDEEYVDSVQPKSLDERGVTKVMATLMQCKEKWIAVKLLSRIQRCEEERVINLVVKMHGYRILNSALSTWIEDDNVVLQILEILFKLPRLTRNKIQDSKIEPTVEKLVEREDARIKDKAVEILKIWSALEVGYRIPRVKRDPAQIAAMIAQEKAEREERRRNARDRSRSRSRSESSDIPKGPSAPSGPRSSIPQRMPPRPPFRRPPPPPLPAGWFSAQSDGRTYFYSASGKTTWDRPTQPAVQPPPPPKVISNEQKLQEIINSITQTSTPKKQNSASATPQPAVPVENESPEKKKKDRKEKWRSYDEEKRKKLYENTLFPHVKHVMDKFKGKLPKDDLKRFAKEVAKKLVNSDFKNNRVEDPTQISSKQEKQVKKYVRDYFDKAVAKKAEHDKRKAEKRSKEEPNGTAASPGATASQTPLDVKPSTEADEDVVLSENEIEDDDQDDPSPSTQDISPEENELKRKREAEDTPLTGISPEDNEPSTPTKRVRLEDTPPPPPPPPPPPAESQTNGDADMEDAPMLEAGLDANEDVRNSFTDEALEAVAQASEAREQAEKSFILSTVENGVAEENTPLAVKEAE